MGLGWFGPIGIHVVLGLGFRAQQGSKLGLGKWATLPSMGLKRVRAVTVESGQSRARLRPSHMEPGRVETICTLEPINTSKDMKNDKFQKIKF